MNSLISMNLCGLAFVVWEELKEVYLPATLTIRILTWMLWFEMPIWKGPPRLRHMLRILRMACPPVTSNPFSRLSLPSARGVLKRPRTSQPRRLQLRRLRSPRGYSYDRRCVHRIACIPILINLQKRKLEAEAHPHRISKSSTGLGVTAEDPRPTSGNFTAGKEDIFPDRTLFHIADSEETTPTIPPPCRSLSLEQNQQHSTLDFEEPSFYIAWKAKQKEKYGEDWTPVPANLVPQVPTEPEPDYLAEFLEWLATTDSIEIVE